MRSTPLIRKLISEFPLGNTSDHGPIHWARVLEIGLELARHTGADTGIVTLFALFHDCARVDEWGDPGHGRRGANVAGRLRGTLFDMSDERFSVLNYACEYHAEGLTDPDPTIGTCWDADRLDLPRVGTIPSTDLLSTAPAKMPQMISRYRKLSETGYIPRFVLDDWLV